jgi:hypothetical protein
MDIITAAREADATLAQCAADEANAWAVCIAELREISRRIECGEL